MIKREGLLFRYKVLCKIADGRFKILILITFSLMLLFDFSNSYAYEMTKSNISQESDGIGNIIHDNYKNTSIELILLSNLLETKLSKLSSLMEVLSTIPQVTNSPMKEFIDKKFNGIPENFDIHKRNLAKQVIEKYDEISLIGFILPNGDVYMTEPFERQKNLTTNNLGFRDYFQKVIMTDESYLSDVIISKSTGGSITVIATPVKSNNKTIGVLYATLDLNIFNKLLQSFELPSNFRIVIVDKNGVKLGDSDKNEISSISNNTLIDRFNFSHLKAFKKALNGETGHITESINNKSSLISYMPYNSLQNVRILLVIQDCNNNPSFESGEVENSCQYIQKKILTKNPLISNKFLIELLTLNLREYILNAEMLLDITSKLPQLSNEINSSLINSSVNGIDVDVGIEKREIAQGILSKSNLFESIFLLLPNGDMYFDEPYARQENLTRDNFVIRDYFKDVKDTNSSSLGNVIKSAATNKNQINLAVPLFLENTTLAGIWAGGLNHTSINTIINNFNITNENELILYLDENGVEVGVSDKKLLKKILKNKEFDFTQLRSFIESSIGHSGSKIEKILEKEYFITYFPVIMVDKTWTVLSIKEIYPS